MTKLMEALRTELSTLSKFMQECNGERLADFKYKGPQDLVLREGREFMHNTGTKLPKGIRWGKQKQCFKNAFELASRHPGLTYVEGYGHRIIAAHHAWVIDEAGNVIDNTWRPNKDRPEWNEIAYLGIPMNMEFVEKAILAKGSYGVLDMEPLIEILKGERNGWEPK